MKHLKKLVGVLLLVAVPMVAWAGVAQAQRFASTVDEGQVVHSSLYSAGKQVTVKGEIFGDVFCAGQNVKVDAIVHGDVLCAGQDVVIAGTVDGDVRATGQMVSISADVARNVTLVGSDVSVDADAKVGQDITVAGNRANIKGSAGRDVVANSTELTLNGLVGRHVRASGSNISLKNNAHISGDFTYSGNTKPKLADGAVVEGATRKTASEKQQGGGYRFNFTFYLFVLASGALILMTLALLFPRYLRRTSDIIKGKFLQSLLVGFLGGLGVLVLCVGLGFTLIGIPLAILLLLGFLLAAALAAPITGYYAGRLVLKDSKQPVFMAAVGAAVLVTSYFLPWIGIIFLLAAFWLGFGALLLDLKDNIRAEAVPKAKAKASK